ncbi:Os03g0275750 [Oryza sativa Japonica Group]|uniref:Os03g0275750 protein n=1 Tax=Oryza sativa subsp. japonica TaxID=39947 RepID=Q10NB3_ORYSJ|nr:hypothetical protein LOC_Os03g16812 [Oryza sativa Japonica Group]BAS83507.1 Os03g0275750 [Oryza sativa Japonica Group]
MMMGDGGALLRPQPFPPRHWWQNGRASGDWSDMQLPRQKSLMGRGGGRKLRQVDSLPRSPMALASRASLAKTESIVDMQELGVVD